MRGASLESPHSLQENDEANFNIGHVLGAVIGLVFTLIGIVIVFRVGAAVLPQVLQALGSIVNNFSSGTTNDTTGDAVLHIGGLVIAVIVVIGLIVLFIESAFAFGRTRGGQ